MALMLSCREISKKFGEIEVIKQIGFDIAEGEKIGLVGLNGAGKSTLANILAGSIEADSGNLYWHKKNINTGYLRQESAYLEKSTEVDNIKNYLYTTNTLGLKKVHEWDDVKLRNLSGGEKTKLSISQIWSAYPDFLILDEPTNHLDYEGVNWLIRELEKYKGTVLIISHDRYFLDQCVSKIMEIDDGRMQEYCGNYSFYREEKKRRYNSQLNHYYQQEKMKQQIDEQIKNLKNWSAKAHRDAPAKAIAAGNKKGGKEFLRAKAKKMDIQVKSRIKRLEKIDIEGVKKPKEENKIIFKLNSAVLKGNRIIDVSDIKKMYPDKLLFKECSFYVQKGEKVGLFGQNGCGKTTLLKLLMGVEELDEGSIFFSSSARPGYLSQDISQMNLNQKVLDFFGAVTSEERFRIRRLLVQIGFNEAMLNHTLSTLSLGELTKLRLAGLINNECDLLLLDEPLNHLDLNSREQLEEMLLNYNGTILFVSHDRYMLEKVCDKMLVFEDNHVKRLEYGLKEYLENKSSKKKDSLKDLKEEKLRIENEISYLLGALSRYSQGSEEYIKMDLKFRELIQRKNELNLLINN